MIKLIVAHDVLQVGQHELLMIPRAGGRAGGRAGSRAARRGERWNIVQVPHARVRLRILSAYLSENLREPAKRCFLAGVGGLSQNLCESAKRCFLARFAGLPQRLQDCRKVEEIIRRKSSATQERPFQSAKRADAEIVEDASV